MDNDGDGNGFFNKRDWNGPIAHKGCFIRCNTARAKVHLRWSSIDDISIKVGISVEKWGKSFFLASLVSGVEEQKNGVLRSILDLITQKWCPSQRLPAVQWGWWCNRFNALIYTGHHHSSQSLLQFNSIEDKVGQNLKKEKLHMNIAMISGTDLALDKVTVHNNRPVRKN